MSVVMRQPGSDSSSESDYDEQLAKKVCLGSLNEVCTDQSSAHVIP